MVPGPTLDLPLDLPQDPPPDPPLDPALGSYGLGEAGRARGVQHDSGSRSSSSSSRLWEAVVETNPQRGQDVRHVLLQHRELQALKSLQTQEQTRAQEKKSLMWLNKRSLLLCGSEMQKKLR